MATEASSSAPVVLVIDDDEAARNLAAEDLAGHAARVLHAGSLAAGLARARDGSPDVVLLDIRLPRRDGERAEDCGLEAIAELREAAGGAPVLVLSSHDSAAAGMQALRRGAADFVAKPYLPEQLVAALDRALAQVRARRELDYLRRDVETRAGGAFLIGETAAMRGVAAAIEAAAPTDATVLVTGETGTGKELVARAIHQKSPRRDRPFVAVNVGAIPRDLVESTLFGHERGAFTGAVSAHAGHFEVAHGGTLFFDEIGELEPGLQVKLLRVLQEGTFERVGGHKALRADVRVVAATHRDLAREAQAGGFRRDLFYRLNVIPVALPPLRARLADLGPLLEIFLARYAARYGRPLPPVDPRVIEELARHDWPGNVRELEHLAQRLVVLRPPGQRLSVDDLPLEYRYGALLEEGSPAGADAGGETVLRHAIAAFERDFILRTLERCGGNRTRAARLLGIHPATMFRKLNRHELTGGEVDRLHPSAGSSRPRPDQEDDD
jgi:DNA-binding NtrC family response regulator